jgi:hypothetical protein
MSREMVQTKTIFILLFLLLSEVVFAQNTTVKDSATLFVGGRAFFYTGTHVNYSGNLQNNGKVVAGGDIDVVNNRVTGRLKFIGDNLQVLRGDTLLVTSLTLEKTNQLEILADQLTITDSLTVNSGILINDNPGAVRVTGVVTGGADNAHVQGNIVRISDGSPMVFPLGINGSYNEIQVSNIPAGEIVFVECEIPEPTDGNVPEEVVGLSENVAWTIISEQDSALVEIDVDYNGVDIVAASTTGSINADLYEPAIVKRSPRDTSYVVLASSEVQNVANDLSSGIVRSRQQFYVYNEPTIIKIARVASVAQSFVYVPNAFSPNAFYEENRFFRPFFSGASGETVSSVSVRIFDNLRNEIYTYSESGVSLDLAASAWDGLLPNGQIAEEGVYYYLVIVTPSNGGPIKKSGSFLLSN